MPFPSPGDPRKKEILLLATTGMDLEGIMLSEIRQRKTNTIECNLSVETEKAKLIETDSRMVLIRSWQRVEGGWKWGDQRVGKRLQASIYNISSGFLIQRGNYC